MRWLVEFYNERRGIVARYGVEAPLPPQAVVLGRQALLAEYPSVRARGRRSLLEQAERAERRDGSEWILYRIANDNGQRSARDVPAEAT